MPITIVIEQKNIIRDNVTDSLINTYHEVLRAAAAPANVALDLTNTQGRVGFVPARILPLVELLTKISHGAMVSVLPTENLELDVVSSILLREYINFLNELLITENLGPKETEVDNLRSPYALMRELLYRLVATVLSNKVLSNNDDKEDKINLLTALTKLIEHKAVQELFTKATWTQGKKVTTFLVNLKKANEEWQQRFTEMLDRNHLVHLNQKVITKSINTLKKIELTIQAHLIIYLDPNQKDGAYAPLWLDTTLKNCEKVHLADQPVQTSNMNIISTNNEYERIAEEKFIVAKLAKGGLISDKNVDDIRSSKVDALYNLHRKTHHLEELLSHLDSVITHTGWIAILLDAFDFSKLADLLNNHYSKFKETTIFPEEVRHYEQKPGIVRHSIVGLSSAMAQTVSGLKHLQKIEVKQYIKQALYSNLTALINLQQKYHPNYQFVNLAGLKNAGFLLNAQSTSQNLLSEPTQSELQIIQEENLRLREENMRLQSTGRPIVNAYSALDTNTVNNSNTISNSTLEHKHEEAHSKTVPLATKALQQTQNNALHLLESSTKILNDVSIDPDIQATMEEIAHIHLTRKALDDTASTKAESRSSSQNKINFNL
jgi:hypothetical protein